MSIKRRSISKEFKLHVVREAESGERTAAEIARRYQIHPNLICKWRTQYETYKDEAFAGPGHVYTDEARIAALERRIAQLEAENTLLKKALMQPSFDYQEPEDGQAG